MKLKARALRSSSIAMLALLGSPLFAQTGETATQPATETATAEGESVIVVTGLRRSLESAQILKRSSDQIIDAIVAEDIGKLPDITASASLARITGVQVTRAAGEAADVQVRGLPDLSTTYNSREIFTAENRSVALQDFPAGGVAALEVYKSSTADLIEGGIAGQINVRSRRPFDFEGLEVFASAAETYFEQSQKFGLNANLLLSNRWETGIGEIGFLINGSYVETKFLDATREQTAFVDVARPNQTTTPGFRFPDTAAVFFGQGNRWRPSINGALQWKPTPELEITIDGLFQGYRGRDFNRYRRVNFFGGTTFSNVVLEPGSNQVKSMTVTNGPDPFGFSEFRNANTDTYQVGGNVTWKGERLRVSGDLAYTDSTFKEQQTNVDSLLLGSPVVDVDFNIKGSDGGPTFSLRDYNLFDPNNYLFNGLFERRRVAKGDDIQARLDVDYDLDLGFLSKIEAGVRFTNRHASRLEGGRFTFTGNRGITFANSALPISIVASDPGFIYNDAILIRSLLTPARKSVWKNIEALRAFAGAPTTPPDFEDQQAFSAKEKTYTGYGQLKYAFDVGFPIDGAIGLRAIRTESQVRGTSRVLTPNPSGGPPIVSFVPVTRGRSYWDYLPNASIRMEFMPDLQLRAAYTETRTKPRFDQLNPSATIDPPPSCATNNDPTDDANCFRTGGGGNPNLRPLQSTNYDLSLEYYFSRAGSASVALFRRDVNGFIANATVEFDDPEFGRLRFNAPDNGGNGRLQGVEVAVASFLDFEGIPQWARGFGLQANYTYIDGKAELAPSLVNANVAGQQVNLFPGKVPIPNVSKHSFNVIALYEIPQFSLRLAYNRRSKYVEFYERFFDPAAGRDRVAPVTQKSRGILDLSATVTPIENVTVFFDATNLTGQPIRTFRGYDGTDNVFQRARKYLERTYSLGIRLRY